MEFVLFKCKHVLLKNLFFMAKIRRADDEYTKLLPVRLPIAMLDRMSISNVLIIWKITHFKKSKMKKKDFRESLTHK